MGREEHSRQSTQQVQRPWGRNELAVFEKLNGGQHWGHSSKTEVGEVGRGQATPGHLATHGQEFGCV